MTAKRQRFAQRRKALGYSQEAFAEMVGTDRTTVGRWERGQTQPYPHMRGKLCQALRVTADELDELLNPAKPDQHAAPSRTRADGVRAVADPEPTGALDDMNRRELLHVLSLAGTAIALPPAADGSSPVEVGQVRDLQQYAQLNAHLWQVFGLSANKAHVSALVQDQLDILVAELDRPHTIADHTRMCELTCELLQLSGEIFFDRDRYTDAAHCYALAASAARESKSYDRWACALTRQAFVSLYDRRHRHAAAILDAAGHIARRGDSELSTQYWVAAVQAQAHAELGDLTGCQRALNAANEVLDLPDPVNPGGWLRFDGTRLDEQQGTCYLALGRTDLASAALGRALDTTVSLRRRSSLLTDLAALGVREHSRDQVISYGHAALDLAEQTQSAGYIGRKLHALQAQLAPERTDTRVAQLDDRITQFLAKSHSGHERTDDRR